MKKKTKRRTGEIKGMFYLLCFTSAHILLHDIITHRNKRCTKWSKKEQSLKWKVQNLVSFLYREVKKVVRGSISIFKKKKKRASIWLSDAHTFMQNKHIHFRKRRLSSTRDRREKLVINIHRLMRNRVPSVNTERNSTSYRYIQYAFLFILP